MNDALTSVATGTIKEVLPPYRAMKRFLSGPAPEFTLVTPEGEQRVRVWIQQGTSTPGDGTHSCSVIVCPVETFESKEGAHSIYITTGQNGHATYV